MKQLHLSVSLIIPAYNEEAYIENCLGAALNQTVPFTEIIVVDNNSTDNTAQIVRRFPSVKLIHESRQGVAYARDAGYNAATGDIIGRIDGDSLLAPNWVETVQHIFNDEHLDAVSGSVLHREVCAGQIFNRFDLAIRRYLVRHMNAAGEHFLFGGNMAMRKRAWQKVRSSVCHEQLLHEDLDLAIHMTKLQQKILFAPELQAAIAIRQADAKPATFYRYYQGCPRTYRAHNMISQRYMYPVVWLVLALYVPIRLAYRGYHPVTGRFSMRCLFSPEVTTGRPSPIAALPE